MSYVKNTWASGDVITAQKLNNLENGVESASGGLPEGGSAGDVLVMTGGSSAEWQDLSEKFVPDYENASQGDTLKINSNGDPAWSAPDLPDISLSDWGKVLTATSEGLSWEEPIPGISSASYGNLIGSDGSGGITFFDGFPDTEGHDGDILVCAGSGHYEWRSGVAVVLPSFDSFDEGKVLSIDNNGVLYWRSLS